jgi:hypothetical protein
MVNSAVRQHAIRRLLEHDDFVRADGTADDQQRNRIGRLIRPCVRHEPGAESVRHLEPDVVSRQTAVAEIDAKLDPGTDEEGRRDSG